jgi:hypothetical protein
MLSVCLCIPHINFWMKLCVYIMARGPTSTAYFLKPSHQSVCLYAHPSVVARKWLGKNLTAAINTHAKIEYILDAPFSMRSVSYQGRYSFSSSQNFLLHTVAYRSVAKQWLGKQRPLLGNAHNMQATIKERCFLYGPRRDHCYATARQTLLYNNRGAVFCAVRAEELSWRQLSLDFRKYKRLKYQVSRLPL